MNPETASATDNPKIQPTVVVVRRAIETLNSLDAETAGHLSALAFVLMRVARADGQVCGDERHQMETILVDRAGIPAEHAALVTEIACHRTEIADSAVAYGISRGLRTDLDEAHRTSIAGLLAAVAEADGCFCALERREIIQLASELGIEPGEVFAE